MNIDEAVMAEQARYLHRGLRIGVGGSFAAVCFSVLVYWPSAAHERLIAWLGLASVQSFYRFYEWRRFRGVEFTPGVARRWLRRMWLGSAITSGLWGAAVFVILSRGPEQLQQLFLGFGIALFGVVAMFSYGAYYPVFLSAYLPLCVPVLIMIAVGHVNLPAADAGLLLIFVILILLAARRFNRTIVESLRLRFENIDLINELRTEKDAAEGANLAKSRFLAAASHDLRQPMHAINLYLGTLAAFQLSAKAHALLAKTHQCAQTMDEMFRALLDMSRLDASAVQQQIRVFPIAPIFEHLRVQFEPQARAKGLELRFARSSAFVRCDAAMVERILCNLVANAVGYTEHGRILVGYRRRGALLRLAVYDTGPGIPSDKRHAVFEEFYQLGNPERDRTKGLGLGLAIVQRLARLLATPITLISSPGRGSMFAVDVLRAAPEEQPATEPSITSTLGVDRLAGALIVVIDDEELILDATRTLLEQWSCQVVTAASAAAAIARLATSARVPDALICDYRLRGEESGVDAVAALRMEFNEDIPALLITGDTAAERIQEITASGLPVLHKPVEQTELIQILSSSIKRQVVSESSGIVIRCDS
ncbi:MAG: response regulator [Gammaproteobacteria bacterium]|nr:response regulator [Gammaproteobacteria bacterium]